MPKPKALVVMNPESFRAHFDDARTARLAALADLGADGGPVCLHELDSPAARHRLRGADVLLTSWGAPALTAERLRDAPALRAVFHGAGSVRPLVTSEVWRRGIRMTSAADANAIPVAEYTLAAIIFAGKKVPFIAADPEAAYRGWSHLGGYGNLSNYRRTVGVVGFSRIGRRVVGLLDQLDATVCLVADPHADPAEVAAAGGVLVDLPELLARSETLTLHAPALPSTHHMIGAAELALLPDHATVVNTARGSLIDSAALAAECRSGRLFAILDVTEPEPLPPGDPLRSTPNVLITPHLAGSLGTEILRLTDHTLDELARWIAGEPLRAEITPQAFALNA
ncbi:hydroxyacid dehydrogenase [Dactylosporangium sp. NPDC049742]|uniref:hydroxyacid dehydrogenase n=1 Tax=Dactylosporangium sp. NPDC049742 TaxID=3154737 RepID=UPI00343BE0BF